MTAVSSSYHGNLPYFRYFWSGLSTTSSTSSCCSDDGYASSSSEVKDYCWIFSYKIAGAWFVGASLAFAAVSRLNYDWYYVMAIFHPHEYYI